MVCPQRTSRPWCGFRWVAQQYEWWVVSPPVTPAVKFLVVWFCGVSTGNMFSVGLAERKVVRVAKRTRVIYFEWNLMWNVSCREKKALPKSFGSCFY